MAVEKLGLNPLMTTLATWWAASGAALGLTRGSYPYDFPDSFHEFGRGQFVGWLFPIWYALFFIIILAIVLKFQRFGYHIYATGGGREAARRQGVKVDRLGISLFVLVALLSAFVGVVFAARIGTAAPNAVDGFALQIIAAGVIGGASLGGGRGSIIGALLGLLFLQMLTSAAFFPSHRSAVDPGAQRHCAARRDRRGCLPAEGARPSWCGSTLTVEHWDLAVVNLKDGAGGGRVWRLAGRANSVGAHRRATEVRDWRIGPVRVT